jgi:hypothetical protein
MHRFSASILMLILLAGCRHDPTPTQPVEDSQVLPVETPQDLLVSALREIEEISDWAGPGRVTSGKQMLTKTDADTLYIYGELTPEGYGATVTERHTYPRGIPLITVTKSHGCEGGGIVSEVKRYTSLRAFQANDPAQTSITTVYGLSQDTILTYVLRNGLQETYTFRLPVVTLTVATTPENTRRVARFGRAGEVVVETQDGNGTLLQSRRNYGLSDGSLITVTSYPDRSWRQTRSLGRSDGSILREVTNGQN